MRAWLLLYLGLGLACSTPSVDDSASAAGGSVSVADLVVVTTTDRSSVRAGEQLRITVTVTNRSSSSKDLRFSSGCHTDFEFLDTQGKVLRSSMLMCTQALTQRTLAAGESFSDAFTWTRGPLDPPELASGSYQLRGVLLATGETMRSAVVAVSLP